MELEFYIIGNWKQTRKSFKNLYNEIVFKVFISFSTFVSLIFVLFAWHVTSLSLLSTWVLEKGPDVPIAAKIRCLTWGDRVQGCGRFCIANDKLWIHHKVETLQLLLNTADRWTRFMTSDLKIYSVFPFNNGAASPDQEAESLRCKGVNNSSGKEPTGPGPSSLLKAPKHNLHIWNWDACSMRFQGSFNKARPRILCFAKFRWHLFAGSHGRQTPLSISTSVFLSIPN